MFSKTSVRLTGQLLKGRSRNAVVPIIVNGAKSTSNTSFQFKRTISSNPDKVFTKLSDSSDKNREAIYKYSWGSWLKNDTLEKQKRITKFSLEGLSRVINDLYIFSKQNLDSSKDKLAQPVTSESNATTILPTNVTISNLNVLNPNEPQVYIKTVSSIHEGKHHHIYKLTTNIDSTPLILRVPYLIDSIENIGTRMKSEIATHDYLQTKLNVNVPKLYSYGLDKKNPLGIPYMIQEYIEGDLLMKSWDPLLDDEKDGRPSPKLTKVIDQVAEIHQKLMSVTFNGIGSLYFKDDISKEETIGEVIDNRWVIGSITERCFWRYKDNLSKELPLKNFLGPWSSDKFSELIKNLGLVEMENAKGRLIKENDAEIQKMLKEQITTFNNLATISPFLFTNDIKKDPKINEKIPNYEELIKPRLYLPDLDPMNIIISKKDSKPYLLDFEGASIKPFILQNSPKFVEYEGPKIYDIKTEIPDFDKLNENEKTQCKFIYKRTRNQYLWENSLNDKCSTLITSMAPPIKLLRSPYIAATERKSDDGYLIIDENLLQLKQVWPELYKNNLVTEGEYPLEFTKEQTEKHIKDINELHQKLISTPFAATQGWVPQDMFDKLVKSGILIKNANGDYSIKAMPPPSPQDNDGKATSGKK